MREEKRAVCPVCFHHCTLAEGQYGRCRARKNVKGKVICENYGKVTALALDPIEKKPPETFYAGKPDPFCGELRMRSVLPLLPEP